jgi:hypothetical protein
MEEPVEVTKSRIWGRRQAVTTLVEKIVEEEHHLEEIARDGYAPATLPIVLGAIMAGLIVVVGLALAAALAAYYLA